MLGPDFRLFPALQGCGQGFLRQLLHSQLQGSHSLNSHFPGIDENCKEILQDAVQLQAVAVFRPLHIHIFLKWNLSFDAM